MPTKGTKHMGKLAASFFISLDGIVGEPQRWQAPYFNDELGAALGEAMASSDGFVLGRVTYEEWAGFWPNQGDENPMAAAINQAPKYVASTTLESAEWRNSTVLEGDVPEAVSALKQESAKDLQTSGSTTLVRSLLGAGLVDELRLMIHPVVVGSGRRLFQDGDNHTLTLVEETTFSTGVISATFALGGQ
jgi:dihydrofolate reductase